MKYLYTFVFFFIFLFSKSFSQEEFSPSKEWSLLLTNNREQALVEIKKKKKEDLNKYFAEEIIKAENGLFKSEKGFLDKIKSFDDFEFYLYALWNQSFFFDNYVSSGFSTKSISNLNSFSENEIENPTVKEAIKYLKAAVARHNNNWEGYFKKVNHVSSIRKWQYCGVFENLNGSGLDTEYGPEKNVYSKEGFNANSNGIVNWYANPNFEKEAYQFYTNHSEYGAGVNYAQTFITNSEEKRVVLRFGSSSRFKAWLNDVLVYENVNDGVTDLDAYNVEVTLPVGINRLLIKNADSGGVGYFIARITDKDGNSLTDLSYDTYSEEYNISESTKISPNSIKHPVEEYFAQKLKADPNNFLIQFCLLNTYIRNSKYTEAKEILSPLLKKYPKSSILKKYMIVAYTQEKDFTSTKELKENIKKDDDKYYLSYVYEFQNSRELYKLPIKEFEDFMNEFSESTDSDVLKKISELLIHLRNENKERVKEVMDDIALNHSDNIKILRSYLFVYSQYLNEDSKSLEILENINKDYFNYPALKSLASNYNKLERKEEVLPLFANIYEQLLGDNSYLEDYINYMHQYKKYEESIPFIEQMLKNFPHSFNAMELMGNALEQTGQKKKSLEYYSASLKHNSASKSLRKKINDLSKEKDYFKQLEVSDVYGYIAKNRNKGVENNYGYNYLLDQSIIQLYEEGGNKSKYTYIVEITSDNGIESLKELDLGLSGTYSISKSELVKPDNSVVPASKSGSNLVFNNLKIGDVIHIDYEMNQSSSGRFYKDYVNYFQFDSFHPSTKTVVKILTPKEKQIIGEVVNGDVEYTTEKIDDFICHTWNVENISGLKAEENYMPSTSDVSRTLHISTIGSWDDIAIWYSDLVRPQLLVNSDVEEAFKEIFPEGTAKLNEDDKAERIYFYIMENFSYSHVSFMQSGYVPKEPSKTIKSKLGDCKDFSALYVTLAQMAGLKSHMVLVLTSDYGERSMVLPNQDFNHCIAKVFIDGAPQYLELTDNNLPYRSIPTSLEGATALDIPNKWFSSEQTGIYKLKNINHVPTEVESHMEYVLGDNSHKLKINSIYKGSINSNYASILKEKNYSTIKDAISEDFGARISEDFKLDSIYNIKYELRSPNVEYTSELTINETMDEIGSLKVFRLPKVNNAYNSSIIDEDERFFPIDYVLYENADIYKSSYIIRIGHDERFVEVPESKNYSFKNHSFVIDYKLGNENELKVSIEANTPKDRIAIEDYADFKKYVKAVIDAKEQLIGFKKSTKPANVSFSNK
ncbi:hypothetical protein GGR42_001885 [Saonia flava]|uniref:Transglutaminase-like domain-containing protein n=1 Tax=Saonia flava TaxID=523696 RepID=A0A846QYZ4_9FLAO|nr:transglutaminase domain-containing protein [Saonia flava]NJB71423.1 hypothetical protein [Saonia flava]